jgi:hypothetical protein
VAYGTEAAGRLGRSTLAGTLVAGWRPTQAGPGVPAKELA